MKQFLIKLLLKLYKPRLIVVFGLYGYKEAREAIYAVLAPHVPAFRSSAVHFFENFNLSQGLSAVWGRAAFPRVVIIDAFPGEKNYQVLRDLLGVDTAIVMPVGDIPSWSDSFAGPRKPAKDILRELKKMDVFSRLLLNYDDETIRELDEQTNLKRLYYGLGRGADLRAVEIISHLRFNHFVEGGISAKVDYGGSLVPFWLSGVYGRRHIYAALAALGTGLYYEINLLDTTRHLAAYRAPHPVLRLRSPARGAAFIEVKAHISSYLIREGLELVAGLAANRKILVVGDIIDVGGETPYIEQLYRMIGERAAHIADLLFLTGARTAHTASEARAHGMREDKILQFIDYKELKKALRQHLRQEDLVLELNGQ